MGNNTLKLNAGKMVTIFLVRGFNSSKVTLSAWEGVPFTERTSAEFWSALGSKSLFLLNQIEDKARMTFYQLWFTCPMYPPLEDNENKTNAPAENLWLSSSNACTGGCFRVY